MAWHAFANDKHLGVFRHFPARYEAGLPESTVIYDTNFGLWWMLDNTPREARSIPKETRMLMLLMGIP